MSNSALYPWAFAALCCAAAQPVLSHHSARGLARYRDHRIHQDKLSDGSPFTNERCGEATQRLRNEHDVLAPTDGFENQTRVLGQPGAFIVAGQIDRHGFVAGPLKQRNHAAPVPGCAARSRYQHERAHRSTSQTPTAGPRSRTSGWRPSGRSRFIADLISPFSPRAHGHRYPGNR